MDSGYKTYPAGTSGTPAQWDFYKDQSYRVPVYNEDAPVFLFNSATDHKHMITGWHEGNRQVPGNQPGVEYSRFYVENLNQSDVLNREGDSIYDYSMRYSFLQKIDAYPDILKNKKRLILKAGVDKNTEKIQVALLTKNGSAFGALLSLKPDKEKYSIKLTDLKPVKTVLLPRPYPGFQSYYFDHNQSESFELDQVEALQISIGPGLSQEDYHTSHSFDLEAVYLE